MYYESQMQETVTVFCCKVLLAMPLGMDGYLSIGSGRVSVHQ